MSSYLPLTLVRREIIAEDAFAIELAAPHDASDLFVFEGGQHLPLRAMVDGVDVRRTYSIVSKPGGPLVLGIRRQGTMSEYLATVPVGSAIEAMPPMGRFRAAIDPSQPRTHVAIAAGSGITPILSIVRSVLAEEPDARVVLYYGNRTLSRTMFADAILSLKNQYLDRFTVHFLMSQEEQEIDRQYGRLNADTVKSLVSADLDPAAVDEWYLCGPATMVADVTAMLRALPVAGRIHSERFGATRQPIAVPVKEAVPSADSVEVTVTVDGRQRRFTMAAEGVVLDAAEAAGLRLPYSCRAGICSTCRAQVTHGRVAMDRNQALEDWEVEAGYILCCQARPLTASVHITYDDV